MSDPIRLVQFIHPGGEHDPDDGLLKRWNTGAHRRKFLRNPGRYVSGNDPDRVMSDALIFWAEWEPESTVTRVIARPLEFGPHYIYHPYYGPPPATWAQNTDPFVFGDCFLYSNCQQITRRGRTQMAALGRGSVILFGSCIALTHFVVDTVFVVDHWRDYYLSDYRSTLMGKVPEAFDAVTLSRLEYDTPHPFRLYFGATYDQRVWGMFSFFPCLPSDTHEKGFARPVIRLEGQITDHLTQGRRTTCLPDLAAIENRWRSVVRQVTDHGLMLGIAADIPEHRAGYEGLPSPAATQRRRRGC